MVGLADARQSLNDDKKLLHDGKDPSRLKKDQKKEALRNAKNTFRAVALEWHENQLGRWTAKHGINVMRKFEADIFPYIGSRPISEIDPPELLNSVLRKIEKRGALDTATRIKQICGQIFRYGVATGKCKRDPSADLRGALKVGKKKR